MTGKARAAALRSLEGRGNGRDSGGRRIRPATSASKGVRLKRPADLSPFAAQHWVMMTAKGNEFRFKASDVGPLTMLCEAWARWKQAQCIVEREGLTVANTRGGERRHPAAIEAERAEASYRSWLTALGLAPSYTTRVVPRDPEASAVKPISVPDLLEGVYARLSAERKGETA
jgi:P27 family predicted phage terminase small subunit